MTSEEKKEYGLEEEKEEIKQVEVTENNWGVEEDDWNAELNLSDAWNKEKNQNLNDLLKMHELSISKKLEKKEEEPKKKSEKQRELIPEKETGSSPNSTGLGGLLFIV